MARNEETQEEKRARRAEQQAKYDRKNTRQVVLKLNRGTDADILGRLDATDNKQGYIKRLIREDIARGK